MDRQDRQGVRTPADLERKYRFTEAFRKIWDAIAGVKKSEEDHVKDRNNPHGVTSDQVGAAPYGYGYGGTAIALKDSSNITSEEVLNTELAKVYDAMKSGETKMITWIMYPLTSGWRWFGILSKSSTNNGSLIAHSAYGGGSNIVKTKNSGAWLPVEWENPPMLPGEEYRTIERWNGKPVYKKLIEYTNPDAISGAMTLTIPHNITGLDMIVTASCTTKNYLLPYLTAGSSLSISAWNSTNLTMYANSSWGAGRKWYIELRYTKTA